LGFQRREIHLIIGVIFIMIGITPFLGLAYAAAIAIAAYLGMRVFVRWRKKQIQKTVGEGICAVCGSKIIENKCPNCDEAKAS
jgi:uncharacterized membrane protein YfcA